MMKKIGKKDSLGITLIALVITIVVLIILAAVAINLSLGNNGIFNRAKTAKESYQNAEAQEQTEIAKVTNDINSFISNNRDNISLTSEELNELVDSKIKTYFDYSNLGVPKMVGKWYNGKPMYEISLAITLPNATTNGTYVHSTLDLSGYKTDELIVYDGYMYLTSTDIVTLPFYANNSGNQIKVSYYKSTTAPHLAIANCNTSYNGKTGYVTLRYTKTTD